MSAKGGHYYPGCDDPLNFYTSDCSYGCGAWMGGSRSGAPDGVDPFGLCPKNTNADDRCSHPNVMLMGTYNRWCPSCGAAFYGNAWTLPSCAEPKAK